MIRYKSYNSEIGVFGCQNYHFILFGMGVYKQASNNVSKRCTNIVCKNKPDFIDLINEHSFIENISSCKTEINILESHNKRNTNIYSCNLKKMSNGISVRKQLSQ